MGEKGGLLALVRRHPYIDGAALDALFGDEMARAMLEASKPWMKVVEVAGAGLCYAEKREPMSTLMDRGRTAIARGYALRVMGKEALLASVAPGFEADGEFFWKERWWRLWVDPGGCAPEALRFVQSPPGEFGEEVEDLVVTRDPGRMESLARQVELTWGGGRKVFVMHAEGSLYRVARPRQRMAQRRKWEPYGAEEMEAHIRERQRHGQKRSLMACVASKIDDEGWKLLVEVGNTPLMTGYELAYLQSDRTERMRDAIARLQGLEKAGLVETAQSPVARDRLEERKALTSLGLEMLAAHWGTTITNMVRMHPWPQVIDRKRKRPVYSVKWLGAFGEHHRLVRQFCLALVHGARVTANNLGEAQVRVVTTIGSRLLYRDQRSRAEEKQSGVVKPDGMVQVSVVQRAWMDGEPSASRLLCERTMWLEVDRENLGYSRLKEKMDGYGRIWESLKDGKPVLVWVIQGKPGRERQILDLMRERGIDGWTVLMERLVLAEDDVWWLRHVPGAREWGTTKAGLRYEAIAGMAPWREIWQTTSGWGTGPLLGVQPWRNRELRRSPPRKGEQEWITYKSS